MKRDMKQWIEALKAAEVKKPLPILSFPAVQLLDVSVREFISDSALQSRGMKLVSERIDASAAVSPMDLSVEAECFGAAVRVFEDEVPTVVGSLVSTMEQAEALAVPEVGACRTRLYIEGVGEAARIIEDRPVFAGVIGPFSLCGRLMDVSEAMIHCYDDPDMVHTLLEKATEFLTGYCKAFCSAGANGVVIAEPLAGLLSPAMAETFSCNYVKRIVDAVQTDDFIVIYHNCGNYTIQMIDHILAIGASAYHFGNAIDMAEMMKHIPAGTLAMGNVDPAGQLRNGTPASVREATHAVMEACCAYPNFVISSGCDVPPLSRWENIDAFFAAAKEFYARR